MSLICGGAFTLADQQLIPNLQENMSNKPAITARDGNCG